MIKTNKIDNFIHVTRFMEGKMEMMQSINTSTLQNEFCQNMMQNKKNICSHCYSARSSKRWKNADKCFAINGEKLSKELIPIEKLPIIMHIYIRLHAHGELINDIHFKNFCNIAIKNPETIFVLWTKRMNIVNNNIEYKPENLKIIYSNPKLNDLNIELPKNADKVFSVYTKKFIKNHKINLNCEKKCVTCRKCYNYKKFADIKFINELIK